MDVQTEVSLQPLNRIEVLVGPTGRRKWPDTYKGQLVAESLVPGVSVREVAERNGLIPNRLSTWRSLARQGRLVVPDLSGADFATVVLDDIAPALTILSPIELETGGVMVRLDADTDVCRLAQLVLALKVGQ